MVHIYDILRFPQTRKKEDPMVEHTTSDSRTDLERPQVIALGVGQRPEVEEPPKPPIHDVTGLLRRWRSGDGDALQELLPGVYDHLHRLAVAAMRGERSDHTLQATALVNEAYLRLERSAPPEWRDRIHFFVVTARIMRRILVDHARSLAADRRGGGALSKSPREAFQNTPPQVDLLALDQALAALADLRPRQAQVLELRFFAGLSVAEVAEALHVSPQTVVLDTRLGRAWLYARMSLTLPSGRNPSAAPN
jgi:RNA polymerase sigma factor (TIGR02999 family)